MSRTLKKPKELDHLDALSKNILVCKKFDLSLTETKHILKDYKEIEIRRKYKEISDTISSVSGKLLKNISLFDLYEGRNIENNQHSLALSFLFNFVPSRLLQRSTLKLIYLLSFIFG